MKGTIKPEETYTKIKNLAEAHTLELNLGNDEDRKLYVITEITKALIVATDNMLDEPDKVVDEAERYSEEILKRL